MPNPARRELNERLDEQKDRYVQQAEVALRVCRLYQSDYCLLRAYLSPPPVCVRAGVHTPGACAAAGFSPPANLTRSLIGPEVRFVTRAPRRRHRRTTERERE